MGLGVSVRLVGFCLCLSGCCLIVFRLVLRILFGISSWLYSTLVGLGLMLLVACVFVGADCFWWVGCWFGSFAGGDVCSGWVSV